MNRSPLFECQNGPSRRAWLRTLGWQVRPTLRRTGRRVLRAAAFVCKWAFVGVLIAAGFLWVLFMLADASVDPKPTPAAKPVTAPVTQPLRRMT